MVSKIILYVARKAVKDGKLEPFSMQRYIHYDFIVS